MDEQKIISDFIAGQLTQLHASAVAGLPEDHPLVIALQNAVEAVNTPVREPVLPAGLQQEEYDRFLEDQVDAVFQDSTVENVRAGVADVVGVIQREDGTYVEFGSVEDSAAAADALVAALEEETGEEIFTDHRVIISYTRLSGEPLDETQVRSIINHPMSAALDHFGNTQLFEIRDTDEPNVKEAVFVVLEEGTIALKTLALNAVAYRGIHVFTGIGAVRAIGRTVNFD